MANSIRTSIAERDSTLAKICLRNDLRWLEDLIEKPIGKGRARNNVKQRRKSDERV